MSNQIPTDRDLSPPRREDCNMGYCNTEHYDLQQVNPENLPRMQKEPFGWRVKKMKTIRLARLYEKAGYERYAERTEGCATWLQFRQLENRQELARANFCYLRLCPMCTARAAIVRAKLLSRVMDGVYAEHKCQYIFLTLTVKNCEGDKLGEELSHLTRAWDRLMHHRPVMAAVKGWFRAIEITRGILGYHPHIHAILAVDEDYKPSNPLYLKHSDLVARWQKALKVDYRPSVRISKTTEDKGGKGAVLEAAKYVTKDSEYINDKLSDEEAAQIVADYTKALYHRRLTAFGGWLKEMAVRLKADDLDHVDLEQGEENTIREDLAEVVVTYGWHFGAGDYVLAKTEVNPLRIKKGDGESG